MLFSTPEGMNQYSVGIPINIHGTITYSAIQYPYDLTKKGDKHILWDHTTPCKFHVHENHPPPGDPGFSFATAVAFDPRATRGSLGVEFWPRFKNKTPADPLIPLAAAGPWAFMIRMEQESISVDLLQK